MWNGYSREALDRIVEDARPELEKFNGERYWDRPRETTGPIDPWPGHHWGCEMRLGGFSYLPRTCNCESIRRAEAERSRT